MVEDLVGAGLRCYRILWLAIFQASVLIVESVFDLAVGEVRILQVIEIICGSPNSTVFERAVLAPAVRPRCENATDESAATEFAVVENRADEVCFPGEAIDSINAFETAAVVVFLTVEIVAVWSRRMLDVIGESIVVHDVDCWDWVMMRR